MSTDCTNSSDYGLSYESQPHKTITLLLDPMNHQQQFFDSLIEYIDARIDKKISDWHSSLDKDEDTAFALKVRSDSAKEELKQALDHLSTAVFLG